MTEITLVLPRDEALVLFELLHRWEHEDRVDEPLDEAENVALCNLSVRLERILDEAFRADYAALVAAARQRLEREVN